MAGSRSRAASLVRVAIADDQEVIRWGLSMLIEGEEDLRLVGTTATGSEMVALAEAEQPDVVIMDIGLPDIDGIAATELVMRKSPSTKVVVLTIADDESSRDRAVAAGACRYLVKNIPAREILEVIREVAQAEGERGPAVGAP